MLWKNGWASHAADNVPTPMIEEKIISHFSFEFSLIEKINAFLILYKMFLFSLSYLISTRENATGIEKNKTIVCIWTGKTMLTLAIRPPIRPAMDSEKFPIAYDLPSIWVYFSYFFNFFKESYIRAESAPDIRLPPRATKISAMIKASKLQ